jgi:hypothetical protein
MITEGIGQHAPAAVRVKLSGETILACYRLAQERATHRNYSGRSDAWGQGIKAARELPLLGMVSQDVLPILVGIVGEYAVKCELVNKLAGVTLNATGDFGVDLKAFGLTMQVKTRQRDSGENLVRVNAAATAARAFCFVEWLMEPMSQVNLLGWCWTTNVVARTPTPSFNGKWKNYVVPDAELLPMNRLADELEAWKAAQSWR